MDEKFGHRGHPTNIELVTAAHVRYRLGVCIVMMSEQGFSHDEAVAFLAGIAHEEGVNQGETWGSTRGAIETIENVLMERGAKEWSLSLIRYALGVVHDLMGE